MRAAATIAVALAAVSSFPLTAQQQDAPALQAAQAQKQDRPATDGGAGAAALRLQPVNGELIGKLDSKSARTGDIVVIKTTERVKTADGTEIPKGSKIVGKVTGVQARGESAENAQIAIKFDHADLKSGQSLAIESVIESLAPAESNAPSAASNYNTPMTAGNTNTTPLPGTNMTSGTNHDAMNGNIDTNRSGATPSSMPAPSTGPAPGGPAPGSIVARNGNVAIRITAIPGVLLATNVTGEPFVNASGIVIGARRDVHLDGGTLVVLALAPLPSGGAAGGMSR
jgi:hypothetical protein